MSRVLIGPYTAIILPWLLVPSWGLPILGYSFLRGHLLLIPSWAEKYDFIYLLLSRDTTNNSIICDILTKVSPHWVDIYTHICIYIYICLWCIHIYICILVYIYMYTYIYICLYICLWCIHIYIYVYWYIYISVVGFRHLQGSTHTYN